MSDYKDLKVSLKYENKKIYKKYTNIYLEFDDNNKNLPPAHLLLSF